MTGYVVEKEGFTTSALMLADVINEMITNGFTQKFPVAPFDPLSAGDTFVVTLEASATVDSLAASQPWRIRLEAISKDFITVVVATPLQLPDDGTFAKETSTGGAPSDILGAIGAQVTGGAFSASDLNQGLINRTVRVGTNGSSYPLRYHLSISPRGFFFAAWEDANSQENAVNFNWVLVQRPVDRDTGAVITTGKAPVWCVNCSNSKYYQFVVRESDILRPGKRRSGTENEEDSEAIINLNTQVRLTEDGKYVINFPSRLNSSRHRYSYELDMIGTTSSDVVAENAMVELEVYGENDGGTPTPIPTPRTYKALQANTKNNTGMRVLSIVLGGGIS